MLVSYAWLREWVSPKISVRELAERLTLGGLEVESVQAAGPVLHKKRVIIGRIIASAPHPSAPRLKVCEVDVGRRANLCIVCGAANAEVGSVVPVAVVGAKLPGLEVQARHIANIRSDGMLCSAAELGLIEHSDGVMLLDEDAAVGCALSEYLDLSDPVLELALTPNRGDCLGILGVAREVAALTGAPLKARRIKRVAARCDARLPVELRAPRACPRYVGRAVRNIDMSARTPDWMAERLRRGGARGVNVVVDITNYVMLELGQPMHAFDMDKLVGGIVVRMAAPREKLHLLDDSVVQLQADNLVIADHKKVVALGGIMGGQNSAISAATRNIYFEAAFFPAAGIIGKARRFSMHTDASHRFERGVDPAMQATAIERATRLLVELAGGEPGPLTDARARAFIPRPAKIAFKQSEIVRLLGASVPSGRVRTMLTRLGMRVASTKAGKNEWIVTVPGWRSDISGAHDLVEEVGRIHGFDKITPRPPAAVATIGRHPENHIGLAHTKQTLVERGYFEAITYSFVKARSQCTLTGSDGIKVRNPIADDMAVMRRSLWPGLLDAVKTNLNRQHERVRLFESGNVFLNAPRKARTGGGKASHAEVHRLAAVASGAVLPRQWGAASRAVDFFDIKGDLLALPGVRARAAEIQFRSATHPALHPGRSARIQLGKKRIGYIGQMHPAHGDALDIGQPVYLFELDLSAFAQASLPHFAGISRYPAVRRDIAVAVDAAVEAQDVLNTARAAAGDLLVGWELFDIYLGDQLEKNQKSFAFGLTFQSESSNLTAGQVDEKTDKIIDALQRRFGAQLRT